MHRELLLVIVGMACVTVHSLDETITFGAPSGPPWAAQIAILTVIIAVTTVQRRLGRWWRLLLAGVLVVFGAFVVSTGWSAHLRLLLERGQGPADGTGVLFLVGGVLVLASGVLLLQQTSSQRFRTAWQTKSSL